MDTWNGETEEDQGMGLRRKNWRTTVMTVLVWGMLFTMGVPQPLSAADTKALTLDDCIHMALDAAPELREAEQDVLAAQADLSQAKAGQWAQMEVIGIAGPVNDADQPLVTVRQNANGRFRGGLREQDEESIGVGEYLLALYNYHVALARLEHAIAEYLTTNP